MREDEANKLWEELSQSNNPILKSDEISKQQFRKFIKLYSHLNDDQINEITD